MANLSVARIQDKGSKNRFVSEEKINFVYKNSWLIVGRPEKKMDWFVYHGN